MPKLAAVTKSHIRQWLIQEITPSEGTAIQIMETFFADLPDGDLSMFEADSKIRAFIRKMNETGAGATLTFY